MFIYDLLYSLLEILHMPPIIKKNWNDTSDNIYACFIKYQKAFDSVNYKDQKNTAEFKTALKRHQNNLEHVLLTGGHSTCEKNQHLKDLEYKDECVHH